MKFANIEWNGTAAIGIVSEDRVLPLTGLAPWLEEGWSFPPATTDELLRSPEKTAQIAAAWERSAGERESLMQEIGGVRFLPAVLNPGKLICIGLNYRRHAEETGMPLPSHPVVFSKFSDSAAGHLDLIPLPAQSKQLDYEAELAIVIGKAASNVTEEEALDYVFGYSCANDISARDLQMQSSQWLLGKTGEGFAPLGPFIATADEIPDPNSLRISAELNGRSVQDSNTSDMIFSCKQLISFLSRHFTLRPGDVILTGTPEGVVLGQPEPDRVWMKDGDTITIRIEGLGELTNRIGSQAG
ncbi:fumarylacetoacetate hydrolase family protein [Saccharibacillus sp. CPCC 101409]|uniref:fumarylacetoacetate hydrolase family protein n=1 Tax=Saccharibacillus sp. CPCC 101409 TaxID=3058041 RepID=UPI002670FFF6|nr:fumarylacetoacetate hydrolase family protein [Saccharibacillus sp. CPCC 101409]MDO3411911.1 fumarylacetoacetate hydrolase family protein [Saccharibacillus sp. CPCC 101409]